MKGFTYLFLLGVIFVAGFSGPQKMEQWKPPEGSVCVVNDGVLTLKEGVALYYAGSGAAKGFVNFELSGLVKTGQGASAGIWFHSSPDKNGYEVLIHNGPLDYSRKTGSLTAVRNLYKSIAEDGIWFPFRIAVRGKNISVQINDTDVVCYTEPDAPFRTGAYRKRILRQGNFSLVGYQGDVEFKDLLVTCLSDDAVNPADTLETVDEQTDPVIRLQQQNFPVIDFHVHLKGWSMDQAHAASMNYGINYGIAPNCGRGFPITDDAGVKLFVDSVKHKPFYFGMQGEGREWPETFSRESRHLFDYVFTDALTFHDHKGRRTRMWIPEETFVDIPEEEYMDLIVDRTVSILNTEPVDIYVNPTLLPHAIRDHYDRLWTKERYEKIIRALKENDIALEINARYKIPNFEIIKAAKDAGIKFTFGTNNNTSEIGKLEHCFKAIEVCGLTEDDLWFPVDRRSL
jgi:hypothetical protein